MNKKIKAVIWGCGQIYNRVLNSLLRYENDIEVVGVITQINILKIDGFCVVDRNQLGLLQYDIVIIMSDKYFNEILSEAVTLGVPREKIVSYRMLEIPNLCIHQYIELLNKRVSIVSNNCWGGLIYWSLALECLSPFKNLYFTDEEYIRLLSDFERYMCIDPISGGYETDPVSKKIFPVLRIGDVRILCNHYSNHEEAREKWLTRREKINYSELFVEMYTRSPQIAEQFATLPFMKKICFVPFETDLDCCCTLKFEGPDNRFFERVNHAASLERAEYDIVALISESKIIRRVLYL